MRTIRRGLMYSCRDSTVSYFGCISSGSSCTVRTSYNLAKTISVYSIMCSISIAHRNTSTSTIYGQKLLSITIWRKFKYFDRKERDMQVTLIRALIKRGIIPGGFTSVRVILCRQTNSTGVGPHHSERGI